MRELAEILADYQSEWGVSQLRLLGEGLENQVFRAETTRFGPVAIRVPRQRVYMNDNDADLDARSLLCQEAELARHMGSCGIPVPAVYHFHVSDDLDFLVSQFVESDGSAPDEAAMGGVTRAIHDCPVPAGLRLVGNQDGALADMLAERMSRRLRVVERFTGLRLPRPDLSALHWSGARTCILHMDMRPANLLTRDGAIAAVVDWSNALLGDPALELARIAEYGHLSPAFREGYGSRPDVPAEVELLYRLDTAIMLAVVFLSEAPDPVAAARQVARVSELCAALS
ncbi:MAG TPA: phosphotransferase [Symbiobacteriaceae bacterium]|nr:phosphotransferase [Symbiobacteriaceae bacterium]